jgi:hypothetical protein
MRYFFDLDEGLSAVPDDLGVEFASLELAEQEALALLLAVALERRRQAPFELCVQLRDETGATLSFKMALSRTPCSVN